MMKILPALAEPLCRFARFWLSGYDPGARLQPRISSCANSSRSMSNAGSKPRRTSQPALLTLSLLSRWFDWRSALTVVTPRTFIGWHRSGFQLFPCRFHPSDGTAIGIRGCSMPTRALSYAGPARQSSNDGRRGWDRGKFARTLCDASCTTPSMWPEAHHLMNHRSQSAGA